MQQQTSIHNSGSLSPQEIESRLEMDRNDVARSFSALRDKLAPSSLWHDAVGLVGRNAGSYTEVLDRAIRANPTALALSAVGLAWLILGWRKDDDAPSAAPSLSGTRYEAVTRWEDEGGPVSDAPPVLDEWTVQADRLRDRAAALFQQINLAKRNGSVPGAHLARHRAEILAALTTDIRKTMARGLEGMTDSARNAALEARLKAYDLHLTAKRKTSEVVQGRPLTTAATLAAAGAALASLLPRSETENRIFGSVRDQIVDELSRVLNDERHRISSSTQSAVENLMSNIAGIPEGRSEPARRQSPLSVADMPS